MLRDYLTVGVSIVGAEPVNPGQLGPTGIVIGPLPAMSMPGQFAGATPTMANFQYLLQSIQNLSTGFSGGKIAIEDHNNTITDDVRVMNFVGFNIQAIAGVDDKTFVTIASISSYIEVLQPWTPNLTINLFQMYAYGHISYTFTNTINADFSLNIINGTPGQIIRVVLPQDAIGNHQYTSGANLSYSTDLPKPILSGPNKIDDLGFLWVGRYAKAHLVAVNKGFSP